MDVPALPVWALWGLMVSPACRHRGKSVSYLNEVAVAAVFIVIKLHHVLPRFLYYLQQSRKFAFLLWMLSLLKHRC